MKAAEVADVRSMHVAPTYISGDGGRAMAPDPADDNQIASSLLLQQPDNLFYHHGQIRYPRTILLGRELPGFREYISLSINNFISGRKTQSWIYSQNGFICVFLKMQFWAPRVGPRGHVLGEKNALLVRLLFFKMQFWAPRVGPQL